MKSEDTVIINAKKQNAEDERTQLVARRKQESDDERTQLVVNDNEDATVVIGSKRARKLPISRKAATMAGVSVAGVGVVMAGDAVLSHMHSDAVDAAGDEDEVVAVAEDDVEDMVDEQSSYEDEVVAEDTGIQVADVNDSMSFAEAFAEARAQVGAGGLFEWHGNTYNTFYQDEWNNLSYEERQDFLDSVDMPDASDDVLMADNDVDMGDAHDGGDELFVEDDGATGNDDYMHDVNDGIFEA